jgi:hypothetical protein
MELLDNLLHWLLTVEQECPARAAGSLRQGGATLGVGGGLVRPLGAALGGAGEPLLAGGAGGCGPGPCPLSMPSA